MSELVPAEGPLLEQILDATHELWHEGLGRPAYGRHFAAQLSTPWGARRLRRVALVDGDEVLASAKLYAFDALLDGRAIRVAGIGALFTQPNHRGRGFARELLTRLLDETLAERANVALLFSEIDPRFYARFLFRSLATCELQLEAVEPIPPGSPAILARAGTDHDVDDLVAMDAARGESFRLRLRRDRDLVHYAIAKKRMLAALSPPGARELQFFVAEEGASAVAYAVLTAIGGAAPQWTIESCGDRDPAGARLGALLLALIARDPAAIRPSITAWLPPGFCPPQFRIVERVPSRAVMMLRPIGTERGGDGGIDREIGTLTRNDVFYWHGDLF